MRCIVSKVMSVTPEVWSRSKGQNRNIIVYKSEDLLRAVKMRNLRVYFVHTLNMLYKRVSHVENLYTCYILCMIGYKLSFKIQFGKVCLDKSFRWQCLGR